MDPSKSDQKIEDSQSHSVNNLDLNGVKFDESIEHEYEVGMNKTDSDPTTDITDSTHLLAGNVITTTKSTTKLLLSSSTTSLPRNAIESATNTTTSTRTTHISSSMPSVAAKGTSVLTTQSSLIHISSKDLSQEAETTDSPGEDTTPQMSLNTKFHKKIDANSLQTASSDTNIDYILNILNLTNASKEYKSRKNIQSNLLSS